MVSLQVESYECRAIERLITKSSKVKPLSKLCTSIRSTSTKPSLSFSKVKCPVSLDKVSVSTPARSSSCAAAIVSRPTNPSIMSVFTILPPVASCLPDSAVRAAEALQGVTVAEHKSEVHKFRGLRRMYVLDLIGAALFAREPKTMKSNPVQAPDRKDHAVVPICKNASGPIVLNTLTAKRYKPRFPFKNETSLSDFIVRAKLGAGAFGVVYRVEDKVTSQTMALKVTKKHGADDSDLEHSLAELDAMKRLMGDRHCMQLEAGFQDEQCLYLALAFYPGGDLHDLIGTYPEQCLPVDHARRYTAELLVGVHHLHCQGIIHRDLKPPNILIDSQGHLVIADLGLAKVFTLEDPDSFSPYNPTGTYASLSQAPFLANSRCGTIEYAAPEIIAAGWYGFAVDFWAVGVMLYEMLVGRPPWTFGDGPNIVNAIYGLEPYFAYDFHPEAKDLLRNMLHKDVRSRPLYESMLRHPFFALIDWKQVEKRSLPPVCIPKIKVQDTTSTCSISFGECGPASDPLPKFNFISPTLKRQRRQARTTWKVKAKKNMQGLQKIADKIFSHCPTHVRDRSATTLVGDEMHGNRTFGAGEVPSNSFKHHTRRRDPPLGENVRASFIPGINRGQRPRPTPNNVRVTPSPSPAAVSPGATLIGSPSHKGTGSFPSAGFKRWINRLLHPLPIAHALVGDKRKTLDLTA